MCLLVLGAERPKLRRKGNLYRRGLLQGFGKKKERPAPRRSKLRKLGRLQEWHRVYRRPRSSGTTCVANDGLLGRRLEHQQVVESAQRSRTDTHAATVDQEKLLKRCRATASAASLHSAAGPSHDVAASVIIAAAVPVASGCGGATDDQEKLVKRCRATASAASVHSASGPSHDVATSASVSSAVPVASACGIEALREKLQIRIEENPFDDCPAPVTSFEALGKLPQHVICSLKQRGMQTPMPIQAQALPLVLAGRDVIGLAQTGSGKTLAFLLPAVVHLAAQCSLMRNGVATPAGLALAPTRELAVQISQEAEKLFEGSKDAVGNNGLRVVCIYGGGDKRSQQAKIRWGVHLVVATPGRLRDFIETRVLCLGQVTYLVLDEADRMLDMGFQEDVDFFARKLPAERQVLFFSATWSCAVQQLAQGLCREGSQPVRISYGRGGKAGGIADTDAAMRQAREGIIQHVVVVDHAGEKHWERQEEEKEAKLDAHLRSVLEASNENKVLVFVSQKLLADKVSDRLQKCGFKADAMHGGKSQEYRLWVLEQFREGKLRLLVCTDVLGRGIDIPSVSHVVIHDMGDIDDYIHRIGRTARGLHGSGHALAFFEYWEGLPRNAAELIAVLEASGQCVPSELRAIADEVASGKRKIREWTPKWKT